VRVEITEKYIAYDGEVFDTQSACERHEQLCFDAWCCNDLLDIEDFLAWMSDTNDQKLNAEKSSREVAKAMLFSYYRYKEFGLNDWDQPVGADDERQ